MAWFALLIIFTAALGIRHIPEGHHAVVIRFGQRTTRVLLPGYVWIVPFLERLNLISVEPLSVSLPPQSAITKDEIPIQLQASLDARVASPYLASSVRDWRIQVISSLQSLMKDKLEDLDFDYLDELFPSWIDGIRTELTARSTQFGVEIVQLRISNLSPRTKPG